MTGRWRRSRRSPEPASSTVWDECLYSNVVVVRPGPGRSVWLGRLTSTIVTEELCEWLDAGAPEPLPPILDVYAFSPRART